MSEKKSIEYRRFILSLIPPAIMVLFLWLVKMVELGGGFDFFSFGIYPRKVAGLAGIFLAPLIHANFSHLANNSIPFFFMLAAIFYFYQKVAWRVLLLSYLVTGVVVWMLARPSYHIGASGLIYSFGSFLFFSGIIRSNISLLAISLLVSFLYGSMVWGILPYRPDMSWESHLTGMIVGILLAFQYRHEGPPPTPFIRDIDEEEVEIAEGDGEEVEDDVIEDDVIVDDDDVDDDDVDDDDDDEEEEDELGFEGDEGDEGDDGGEDGDTDEGDDEGDDEGEDGETDGDDGGRPNERDENDRW